MSARLTDMSLGILDIREPLLTLSPQINQPVSRLRVTRQGFRHTSETGSELISDIMDSNGKRQIVERQVAIIPGDVLPSVSAAYATCSSSPACDDHSAAYGHQRQINDGMTAIVAALPAAPSLSADARARACVGLLAGGRHQEQKDHQEQGEFPTSSLSSPFEACLDVQANTWQIVLSEVEAFQENKDAFGVVMVRGPVCSN